MAGNGQRIRASLIRALQETPLLVEAERSILSSGNVQVRTKIRGGLRELLAVEPLLLDSDELAIQSHKSETIDKFREAMAEALSGGSSLAEAERAVLGNMGLEKLGEFRSTLRAHLDGPAEIPEQDLAIYVPAGEHGGSALKKALEEQLKSLSGHVELVEPPPGEAKPAADKPDLAPSESALPSPDDALPTWDPTPATRKEERRDTKVSLIGSPASPGPANAAKATRVQSAVRTAGTLAPVIPLGSILVNPLSLLTSALEAVAGNQHDFGFLLRFGRYASDGRKSEFLVGGMGLAELSKKVGSWFEAQGAKDCQLQVVDDGSGELTIYLLEPEGVQ